jgi:hypothetical protein
VIAMGRHSNLTSGDSLDLAGMSKPELALTADAHVVAAAEEIREWLRLHPGRDERLIEAINALSHADVMLARLFTGGSQSTAQSRG